MNGQIWQKAVRLCPHDAGVQIDIILRHYAIQYGVDIPRNLPTPFDFLAEKLKEKGYLSTGDIARLLGVSHPTARKRLIEFRRMLGLSGTGQRSRTKFSWYFISISELSE